MVIIFQKHCKTFFIPIQSIMIKLKDIKNQKINEIKLAEILFYTFPLSFIIGNFLLSLHLLLFIVTFLFMEWFAWFLHKYVMHGPLWILHEDHHTPRPHRKWQLNDFFAFFFAVPSFLFILFDP